MERVRQNPRKNLVNYIATRDGVVKNISEKEKYVDYIAGRPRVQKIENHGLFSSEDKVVNLEKVKKEIENHNGNVWLPIISLKREDAQKFGYEDVKSWQNLLIKQASNIAKGLKIKEEDFVWYGAFHNESHHPHVHMVCYLKKGKSGFLTEKGIESIKSMLTNEIFKNEL